MDIAFQDAELERNVTMSAKTFSRRITTVLETVKIREEAMKPKWTTKLGSFVQKIYPIVRLALGVTNSLSQATPFSMPLKIMVDGLGVILQVTKERGRLTSSLSIRN